MFKTEYNKKFRAFFKKFEREYFALKTDEERQFAFDLGVRFVEKNRDFVMQYPLVQYWETLDSNKYLRFHDDVLATYTGQHVNLYFHIPFCKTRCSYCNFHIVVGDAQKDVMKRVYLKKLRDEIDDFVVRVSGIAIDTIFIWGGTPSYLDLEDIEYLFSYIKEKLGSYFTPEMEFTFEGNPDSYSLEKLKLLKQYGVNRISFWVQSFDNEIIKNINRTYDRDIVLKRIEDAKSAGFDNINIDMIYGLPGHNYEIMKEDLLIASELPISHLTYYPLYYYDDATLKKVGKEQDNIRQIYDFYDEVVQTLDGVGYVQYGREYFSKDEKIHHYQNNYVSNGLLYGFGHSAYSFTGDVAFYKKQDLRKYLTTSTSIQSLYRYNSEDRVRRLLVLWSRNIKIMKDKMQDVAIAGDIITLGKSLDLIREEKDAFVLTKKWLKYQEVLAHMCV